MRRAEAHARDVLQAHGGAVRIGAQDDVLELVLEVKRPGTLTLTDIC